MFIIKLTTMSTPDHRPPPHLRHYYSPLLLLLLLSLLLSTIAFCKSSQEANPASPISRFQNYLQINTAHPKPDYSSAISFLTNFSDSIPSLQSKVLYFSSGKPLLLLTLPGSDPTLTSILLNSHLDSVPAEPSKWVHPPFAAHRSSEGKIFARGAQDDKCIGLQYLEAIKSLKEDEGFNFTLLRSVHVSFVPDEEIGGFDGMAKFTESEEFRKLNVGFVLDEGQASPVEEYRVFYADRTPWNLVIRAVGMPGHGSTLFENSAMENLMNSIEMITKFRDTQFDMVKAGFAANSEVISVNSVFLKAGTPSPTGFVMNMQPSEAEAGFDVRLPPTADPDAMRKRIIEEWAPASRNMTFEIIEKGPLRDYKGDPMMTLTNDSNSWWSVFKEAVYGAGGKLADPEILASTTDARFMRQKGIPTIGFSPMKNTPILLHDHNEFLLDTVYLEGIGIYKSIIKSLSSFVGSSVQMGTVQTTDRTLP